MIEAKPVVADRYWILKQGESKVGTVEADEQGFAVRIQNRVQRFQTIPMVRSSTDIDFQPVFSITPQPRARSRLGLPAPGPAEEILRAWASDA